MSQLLRGHEPTPPDREPSPGDALGHHPSVSIGNGYVDIKAVSYDAICRDDEGTQHVVEWVTQQDVDLARRITEIAADTTGALPVVVRSRRCAEPSTL